MPDLPRLLSNLKPAPGLIKQDYTDFLVEEIPAYEPGGEGTHAYFLVEKAGLSTMNAVNDIAHALNRRRQDIGYAGLKDARAITRQWMSLEHCDPSEIQNLEIPRIRIVEVSKHTNKLKLGHLRGNRFTIRVRQTQTNRLAELQDGLARLVREGVPNYFGRQRFGGRGDAWEIGRAIVRNNPDEAIEIMLGRPSDQDRGNVRKAREAFTRNEFDRAAKLWPGMFRDERRALKALAKTGGNRLRAFNAVDRSLRKFLVSAYQSHLFNEVVAQRLRDQTFTSVLAGDLAEKHDSGAVFRVEDPAAEQPRAERFEISATGPLFGYRMSEPGGDPGALEATLLEREQLSPEAFRSKHLRVKGARRALRFHAQEARLSLGADQRGAYLELVVTLASGCYATSLLRELFEDDPTLRVESPTTSGDA